MKRRPFLLAFALWFLIGAALWGVNWRLDHPPLSDADKEFRALVAGADETRVVRFTHEQKTIITHISSIHTTLNAIQTHELIESLRFVDSTAAPTYPSRGSIRLEFSRHGKALSWFDLTQTSTSSQLQCYAPPHLYNLNPRFEKPLRRTLDQVLPQRLRP